MKRSWSLRTILGLTVFLGATEHAQAAPTLRLQVNQKGDFELIGNTLGFDCAGGTPVPVVGSIGACGISVTDSAPDIFWRADAPSTGQAQADTSITLAQARSTAVLTLPPGATVSHAFLYWSGILIGGDNAVTLDRPGTFTQNVTALQVYQGTNNAYQGVADVTSLVQANGAGAYRVSDVNGVNLINLNDNNPFMGWWMVVFYELVTDPPRNLALFEGLDVVMTGQPVNATLTGFLVPSVVGNSKLGIVAFDGDNSIAGDSFSFGLAPPLTNAENPTTNFFNGTRSFLGTPVSNVGDLPQLTGAAQSMSGMDIDVVDVTNKLVGGQTSVPISATSTGDVYFLAGFVTSIPTFQPDFTTSQKMVQDLNGGSYVAGDVIQYTIVVENSGNDTSVNTILTDPLPSEVTYVPGSLSITSGANIGTKTDASGDDQCEFDTPTKTIICRLGTGANASSGGELAAGTSTTVTFQVTINPGISGTIANQAVIQASGQLGSPTEDTLTDGNGSSSGQSPTEIFVNQCDTDALCASPTPYCNIAATPSACVECLMDSHCPANQPQCDAMTNTCVCVSTGAEICDGVDNDCNGTIDDGFDVGTTCTVGLGACMNSGNIVCNGPNASICNVVAGTPTAEVCGDNIDNNCDGAVDNGFNLGQPCTVGIGGCATSGTFVCNGPNASVCNALPGTPTAEICDGIDNNCDGAIDEGFNLGTPCTVGTGGCATSGTIVCNGPNASVCNALPGTPTAEICGDGIDNNCDGVVDNGFNLGQPCTVGIGGCTNAGTIVCNGPNASVCNVLPGTPTAEICGDGIDNNCDGAVDNGFNLGQPCTAGMGACVSSGTFVCNGPNASICNAIPGMPSAEVCGDGIDNDCNGTIDNGCSDSDNDGIPDPVEIAAGTDPNDADSDDDGVLDGNEIDWNIDSDGDGLINALDSDSDNDGIFDGTEMGLDCSNPDTNPNAAQCIPDADKGLTKTDPLDSDTDNGGVSDGGEDANKNGAIDPGETNPNNPADDVPCVLDADCGTSTSGKVCDGMNKVCIDGCRGTNGNGCPNGEVCSSMDDTIGMCNPSSSSSSGIGGFGGAGGQNNTGGAGGIGGPSGSGGGQAGTGGAGGLAGEGGTNGTGGTGSTPPGNPGSCDCAMGATDKDTPARIWFAVAIACAALRRSRRR